MCSAMELHVTWTGSATAKMSQDPLRTGERGREKQRGRQSPQRRNRFFFWKSNEVRGNVVENVEQHDTKNTVRSCRLLMRSLCHTTLVILKRGGWPVVVSCGGQSNKYRASDYGAPSVCQELGVDVFTSGRPVVPLLSRLRSPHCCFYTAFLHPYITQFLRFEHMVIVAKIPNPHHQQAEWPQGLRTSLQTNRVRAWLPHKTP